MMDYLIVAIVLLLMGAAVVSVIRAKKNGKKCSGCSGCSAGCSGDCKHRNPDLPG